MKLVLLSGGTGKHLWPLFNDTRSKQFLITDDEVALHPVEGSVPHPAKV